MDFTSDGINCEPFCWLNPLGWLMSYGFNAVNDGFGWRSLPKRNASGELLSGSKLNVSIFHYH